jgi:pseudouridine kinase
MGLPVQRVYCIGGAAIDRKYRAKAPIEPETSNPVTAERTFGGVARNVAENIARLGGDCTLVSVIGDDENGRAILGDLRDLGIDTRFVEVLPTCRTAEYVAVLQPSGDLFTGLADMAIFDAFTPSLLDRVWPEFSAGQWVFADCNLPDETLRALISARRQRSFTLTIDAVSTSKAKRLPHDLHGVDLLFLNVHEASALLGLPADAPTAPDQMATEIISRGAARVILTLGMNGLIVADRTGTAPVEPFKAQIVDATGAGDALIAAAIVGLMNGMPLREAVRHGTVAASLTIGSPASVRPDLSLALLESAQSMSRTVS